MLARAHATHKQPGGAPAGHCRGIFPWRPAAAPAGLLRSCCSPIIASSAGSSPSGNNGSSSSSSNGRAGQATNGAMRSSSSRQRTQFQLAPPRLYDQTFYYPLEDALGPSHRSRGDDWRACTSLTLDAARFRGRGGNTLPARDIAAKRRLRRRAPSAPWWRRDWLQQLGSAWARARYEYYIWRRDAGSDLLVMTGVNLLLVTLGTAMQLWLLQQQQEQQATTGGDAATDPGQALWQALYSVTVLSFGENFPDASAGPAIQVFGLLTAFIGLVTFALLLALVQQVVLDANTANVRRGAPVYEEGHYLILGWCQSQRDLVVVMSLVNQVVAAYAHQGGTTIVVMTQREKLEMEELFRRLIPEHRRAGSRLVFRQGSPLMPRDLVTVAAGSAASTVIISDQSRSPDEADAQSVRCAILLDELDDYRGLRRPASLGHVVVEMATTNAIPLLRFSCSGRTMALPTGLLNARRLSKMVKRPFISWVTQRVWNFDNDPTCCIMYYPQLVGCRFQELGYRFPRAVVFGVARINTSEVVLNPPGGYVLEQDDHLVMLSATSAGVEQHQPLDTAAYVPHAEDIAAALRNVQPTAGLPPTYSLRPSTAAAQQRLEMSPVSALDSQDLEGLDGQSRPGRDRFAAMISESWGSSSEGISSMDHLWDVPADIMLGTPSSRGGSGTTSSSSSSLESRAGGGLGRWESWLDEQLQSFEPSGGGMAQQEQQRDSQQPSAAVPAAGMTGASSNNSSIRSSSSPGGQGGVNTAVQPAELGGYAAAGEQINGAVSAPPVTGSSNTSGSSKLPATNTAGKPGAFMAALMQSLPSDKESLDYHDCHGVENEKDQDLLTPVSAANLNSSPLLQMDQQSAGSMASLLDADDFTGSVAGRYVPQEYLQYDEQPVRLVLLGWADAPFMVGLLRELDGGSAALPAGSEVVCVNTHAAHDDVDPVIDAVHLRHLKVTHVFCDPLQRSQLEQAVDFAQVQAAMVLCDEWWVDPDHNADNGVMSEDGRERGSVLRLDAMMLLVQLNVRKLLEERALPPINIICQKLGSEGLTRFEDRKRLPLGISVNLATFSAKMLAQVAHNPLAIQVYCAFGQDSDLLAVDAEELAPRGAALSWWQLHAIALSRRQVLWGYYIIPAYIDQPIISVCNPQGVALRSRPRVWNNGDGQLKFILLREITGGSLQAAPQTDFATTAQLAALTASK